MQHGFVQLIKFVLHLWHFRGSDAECDEIRGKSLEEIRAKVVTGDTFKKHFNTSWKQGPSLALSNTVRT